MGPGRKQFTVANRHTGQCRDRHQLSGSSDPSRGGQSDQPRHPLSNEQFSALQSAFLFAYALMYAGGGNWWTCWERGGALP